MTLGEIIKKYRKEHKMSMDAFADKSGISKSYISIIEKNKHPKTGKPIVPSVQYIKQAADGMDMDFNELFAMIDGDVELSSTNEISITPNASTTEHYCIPIIATVAAGQPIYSEEHIEGYVDYCKDPKGHIFAAHIKGHSMEPEIRDGDLIVVDQEAVWSDGDIVLVTVNGDEGTCKRIRRYADGIRLIPLNPTYDPLDYSATQVEELPVKVVGRVVESRKKW